MFVKRVSEHEIQHYMRITIVVGKGSYIPYVRLSDGTVFESAARPEVVPMEIEGVVKTK